MKIKIEPHEPDKTKISYQLLYSEIDKEKKCSTNKTYKKKPCSSCSQMWGKNCARESSMVFK